MNRAVETQRLVIFPLTQPQLRRYLSDRSALGRELRVDMSRAAAPAAALRRAIGVKLSRMGALPISEHHWITYWLIATTEQCAAAGFIGFKGAPGPQGAVEVGYGLEPDSRGMGYMAEALRGMVNWAWGCPACVSVTAQTDGRNLASAAVLRRAGFGHLGTSDDVMRWQLRRQTVGPTAQNLGESRRPR